MEISNGVFEVKATNGDTSCGGEDLDAIILEYMIKEFKNLNKVDITKDKMAI